MIDRNHLAMIKMLIRGLGGLLREEHRQGDALGTLFRTIRKKVPTYKDDRTVGQELYLRAERHPHKVFLDYGPERWTYHDMNQQAARLAHRLKSALPGGGAVGIMGNNSPEFLAVFFATQKAGLTCVPINRSLKSEGLQHILENGEVAFLFIDSERYIGVQSVLAKVPRLRHVVAIDRRSSAPEGIISYDDFLGKSDGAIQDGVKPDPKASSLLMYTSGTTGLPKGVTYRYGECSQVKLMRFFAHANLSSDDVYYTCLPLFHANALIVTVLGALYVSGRVVLADRFSASQFWNDLRAYGVTVVNTFTSMIPVLMKQPPSLQDKAHKVRKVFNSGLLKEYWTPFQERFGVRLIESYGAVDGGGILLFNMGYAPPGSLGKPLPGTRYRLIGDDGGDVKVGEPGELIHCLRKQDLKFEYHKNPEASQKKVRNGWVYSGDLLSRDEKGYLYFVGRKNDAIRRRGENIAAMEVESAVMKHPNVCDCAAFGVPAELGEEEVMVAIVPVEGKFIDYLELSDFLKDHLPEYAIPRYIDIVSELPKTETHRVRKNILKSQGISSQTWDREKVRSVVHAI